jgi:phage terminase large subunit-like protein
MENSFTYRDFEVTVRALPNSAVDGRPWADLKPTTFSFSIVMTESASGVKSCAVAPKKQLSPREALREGEAFAKAHIDSLPH